MEDKRNEHRKQWWQIHHAEHEVKPSMKRRKVGHDYYGRCIYMVTIVVKDRKPILGNVQPPDDKHPHAWLQASELGLKVLQCWREIRSYYPQIQLKAVQLMPDHLHGVLFVTDRIPIHLGQVINGFKKGCNDVTRSLLGTTLWEGGYHDRILRGNKKLVTMVRYMRDNPHRLWVKRNNPDYFRVQQGVKIGHRDVMMAGNRFLLDYPMKVAVKCSRSLSEEDITNEIKRHLSMVREGAVLVSPCISPGEKAIMRAAFDAGAKEIVLLENGFSPMWKPGGSQFDACAEGRLLLIAPWPHHNERLTITRSQCNVLNAIAREIADMGE